MNKSTFFAPDYLTCSHFHRSSLNTSCLRCKASRFIHLFFLEVAERPEEAPAGSLEKKIYKRELATNSWNRHINLFILEKRVERMKHLLNLFD